MTEQGLYPCMPRDAYEKIGYEISKNGADSIHNVVEKNGPGEDSAKPKKESY